MNPDKRAIAATLEHYRDAYESESMDELLKVWPTMSKKQKKDLKDGFQGAQAVKVQLSCGDPSVSGDGATVRCEQSVRYTIAGKVQPYDKQSVDIVLKRAAGGWLVSTVRAD